MERLHHESTELASNVPLFVVVLASALLPVVRTTMSVRAEERSDDPTDRPKAATAEDGSKKQPSDSEETELQMAARKMAVSVRIAAVVDGKKHDLKIFEQPVLRFGDIPRANDKGSVWIWQRQSRPQAIMELYRGTDGRSWVHVIHSLASDPIDGMIGADGPKWSPEKPGIEWSRFEGAPVPAERAAVRARQIKELAQRFTAHEFWDPNKSRFELRLLIHPVHTYSDSDSGLLAGAVFLLCHETNPEVVLLIEAVQEPGTQAGFRYALARLGHAELHVEFDAKEVWTKSRVANTISSDPYFLSLR